MKLSQIFILTANVSASPELELKQAIGAIANMISAPAFSNSLKSVTVDKWYARSDAISAHLRSVLIRCGDHSQ